MKGNINLTACEDPADVVQMYMHDANHETLDADEQEALCAAIAAGPPERARRARARLVRHHLRLVISVANRYRGRGVDFADLIQEGNVGLLHAGEKFDPTRGIRFGTYATWWIRHGVTRALANQGRAIRLPVWQYQRVSRVAGTLSELRSELQREPTLPEIAGRAELTQGQAEEALGWCLAIYSLDQPMNTLPDAAILGDFVPASDDPAADALANQTAREMAEVLEWLAPNEAQVLSLRYGLRDGQSRTLEEVGAKIGRTRERVRQIEVKALRRLRAPSRVKPLRAFL